MKKSVDKMDLGIVGKPNVGKSTFFASCTLSDTDIANYPFTTIDASLGVAHLIKSHPCKEIGCNPDPENYKYDNEKGKAYLPVNIIDVAGLVPEAWKGKGLGNKFLDDLRQANGLIHVIDASGKTDAKGEPTEGYNPLKDLEFLEKEIDMWLTGIIEDKWKNINRRVKSENLEMATILSEKLAGIGINESQVRDALRNIEPKKENITKIASKIRKESKPMVIAANKADSVPEEELEDLLKRAQNQGYNIYPTSAESELALVRAADKGLINYKPGDNDFKITGNLSDEQKNGLEKIRNKVLGRFGGTGVQKVIQETMVNILNRIVVYPVEDTNKLCDNKGNVLPHAFLMEKNSNPHDLAYKIHSDIGDNFLYAVNAKTDRRISEDYQLKDNDIIKIVSTSK